MHRSFTRLVRFYWLAQDMLLLLPPQPLPRLLLLLLLLLLLRHPLTRSQLLTNHPHFCSIHQAGSSQIRQWKPPRNPDAIYSLLLQIVNPASGSPQVLGELSAPKNSLLSQVIAGINNKIKNGDYKQKTNTHPEERKTYREGTAHRHTYINKCIDTNNHCWLNNILKAYLSYKRNECPERHHT